jgi:hypothetical protein
MDDTLGVNVQFDSEEEEELSDFEIRDGDSDDEDLDEQVIPQSPTTKLSYFASC